MSFFAVKNYSDEFFDALSAKNIKPILSAEEEDETVAATADDIDDLCCKTSILIRGKEK